MKLNPFALISFFLSVLTLFSSDWSSRPNVVLILVDDLGWQDVGCYDIDEPTPMETPHIDSLAKKGFNFGRDIHRPPHVLQLVAQSLAVGIRRFYKRPMW